MKAINNKIYTELIFINRNKGKPLPDEFWKKVPFKFQYGKIIKCIGAIAKGSYCGERYSDEAIINAIEKKNICFWKFERDIKIVHYYVQVQQEIINKKNAPKDYTKKEEEKEPEPIKDYRTEKEASIRDKSSDSLLDLDEKI